MAVNGYIAKLRRCTTISYRNAIVARLSESRKHDSESRATIHRVVFYSLQRLMIMLARDDGPKLQFPKLQCVDTSPASFPFENSKRDEP